MNFGLGNGFLDLTSKSQETKEKTDNHQNVKHLPFYFFFNIIYFRETKREWGAREGGRHRTQRRLQALSYQ